MLSILLGKNYFYHCDELRAAREKELEEEHLHRSSYDDELDAELVGHPPASCTGFYPRTGNLQAPTCDVEDRVTHNVTQDADNFVIVDEKCIEGSC